MRIPVSRMIGGPSIGEVARMAISELEEHPALAAADLPSAIAPEDIEPPMDPLWSHLGAAAGGAIGALLLAFIAYQVWSTVH